MSDTLSRRGKGLHGSLTSVGYSSPEAPAQAQPPAAGAPGSPAASSRPPALPASQPEPRPQSAAAMSTSSTSTGPAPRPQPPPTSRVEPKAGPPPEDTSTALSRPRTGASDEQEKLVSLYYPHSPQAKRIDILRSQLLFPFHGDPPRTIMVTSAVPKEGRSLLAANLAISFARGLQQFVMLMDCHLSDPALHSLLNVPRQPGLSDFLEHNATIPDIMHRTSVNKLTILPAGTPSQRSSEILATDKMAGLLNELRARYRDRYMILDTPPVQAFDDPAVLARLVEGIVFVVLSGKTDREQVLRGLRSLPEEKIVGVVLNDMLGAVSDTASLSSIMEEEG